jgi:iron complex transport system substrate-binding protein
MRIVSLLPSATEILYAIGAGDEVVGVTHECDYPEAARAKPRLTSSALPPAVRAADIDRHVRASLHAGSSIYALDAALLERLKPDLIVTQELCPVCAVSYDTVCAATRRLASDARLVSLEPSSLEDVYATIESVGALTGHAAAAAAELEALRKRESALRQVMSGLARPSTLVLEWTDPPMSGGHWTPGLVELAGGTPVLSNPGADSQRLSWEAIAAADPDVVIVAPCGFGVAASMRAVSDLADIAAWNGLRAVRSGRVAIVDGNAYVNRPGPRLLDTAEIFAAAIHPELAAKLPAYPAGWELAGHVNVKG